MMSENKKLKKAIRARKDRTGESYSTARMHVLNSLNIDGNPVVKDSQPSIAEQIRLLLDVQPDLTIFGFRAVGGRGVGDVSKFKNADKFQEERNELLSPDGIQQVLKCLRYLEFFDPLPPASADGDSSALGSYVMKHEVEYWLRKAGLSGYDKYISNGAFIVAAMIREFPIYRDDPYSPNCFIGIDRSDVAEVKRGRDPRELKRTAPFLHWLTKQTNREDDIGMLAEDFVRDDLFPRTDDIQTVRDYLGRWGDHTGDWLSQALSEFSASSASNNT